MKKILVSMMLLTALVCRAQENARYRITYDCDAQYAPERKNYRWHLDIGTEQAAFYNPNQREFDKVKDEIVNGNDVTIVMGKLNDVMTRFPNPIPLQVLVPASDGGKYTYLNKDAGEYLCYEEPKPDIDWEMTDRDSTVCGYACLQARARVYGREWTVWFAPEIPLSYGPYVLGGLPGLILDAEDSDGLFHFTAVGLQQDPEGATVSLAGTEKAIRSTRSKYMKLRERANGQSLNDILRGKGFDDKIIKVAVKVVDAAGKDVDLDASRPKHNFLDVE